MGVETGRAVAPTPMGGAGGELPGSGALGGSKVILSHGLYHAPFWGEDGKKKPHGHPIARGPVAGYERNWKHNYACSIITA